MKHDMNMPAIVVPNELTQRIKDLAEKDQDLLEREQREDAAYRLYTHCKRIWQKLDAGERQVIRHTITDSSPTLLQSHLRDDLVEDRCIDCIRQCLQESALPKTIS